MFLRIEESDTGERKLLAEVIAQASNGEEATKIALDRTRGFASILGLETNIGLVVEEDLVTAVLTQPPATDTRDEPRHVRISDEARGTEALHLELIPSPDRLLHVYRRFLEIADSTRSALIPLAESYNLSWHEQFDRSRFLTLVSVIEALSPPPEEILEVQEIVEQAKGLVFDNRASLKQMTPSPEVETEDRRLAQLFSRLEELRRESIRDRLHRLVASLEAPVENAQRIVDDIYDLRSRMLHDYLSAGQDRIPELTESARQIAAATLQMALGSKMGEQDSTQGGS